MSPPFITSIIFLCIAIYSNAQDFKEIYWPSELNEHGYNVWVSEKSSYMDRWLEDDNEIISNPFQHLTAIHPCDSSLTAKYNLGEKEGGAYIFTFGDSLSVQTYDGLKKEIIKTKSYRYEKSPFNDRAYLIYMDGYCIRLTCMPTYGYFHFVEVDFIGLPVFGRSERNEWLVNIQGKTNIFHCENNEEMYSMSPLTMKNTGRGRSLSNPLGKTKEDRMFAFLTFGDSLRIHTYDAKLKRTVKAECYKYEPIENTKFSLSYWVYLTDRKIKMAVSPMTDPSHYSLKIDCE